jgi:hypothetical protein
LAAPMAAVTATARSELAVDLGALGGTRTPSRMIRRSVRGVQPVRRRPYPQVRACWVSSARGGIPSCPTVCERDVTDPRLSSPADAGPTRALLLPRPPRSCLPLAAADVSRLA